MCRFARSAERNSVAADASLDLELGGTVGAHHLGQNLQIRHDVAAQHEIGKNKIGSEREDQGGTDGGHNDQNQLALDGQISIRLTVLMLFPYDPPPGLATWIGWSASLDNLSECAALTCS